MGEWTSKTKPDVPSLNLNLNLNWASGFGFRDSKKDHLNKSGYLNYKTETFAPMKNFYKNERPRSLLPSPKNKNSPPKSSPTLPFPKKHSADEKVWHKFIEKRSFRKSSVITGAQENSTELTHYDKT